MRLLLLSDTHLPRRAKALPDQVWAEVDAADLVVHAGDWVSEQLLDDLSARADVLGCWGNNDGPELRARLPKVATRTVESVRLAVVHETGSRTGRELRADVQHPDTDVLIFGHSHIPWDTTTSGGMRLLNPGSPTDRRRQPAGTIMTASAADGELRDVRLVEVVR